MQEVKKLNQGVGIWRNQGINREANPREECKKIIRKSTISEPKLSHGML